MARKGNPISVRLDLNRSSDPSRFSEGRALRQFTLSTGKSAGRNSSGRITVFHRGGGSKRLKRRIDLKRSTSSMGRKRCFQFVSIEKQIVAIYAAVKGFWGRMPRFLKTLLLYLLFCFINSVLFSCLGIQMPFPSIFIHCLCEGSDNEDSSGDGLAQQLSQVEHAPHTLRERVKRELRVLFNIGYERERKESKIAEIIETLAIDTSSEAFLEFFLKRINELQAEHFNGGQHKRFAFSTKAQKERLYSALWEFSGRGGNNDE